MLQEIDDRSKHRGRERYHRRTECRLQRREKGRNGGHEQGWYIKRKQCEEGFVEGGMCLIELTGCVRSRYSLVGRNQELSFLGVGPAGYRAQVVAGLIHRDAGQIACKVDMFEYRRTG